jgi:CRISPR/Cas system Type II protein with McrA/HNH and RuvC-like nuclease domain
MKKILGLDIGTTSIGWAIVEATEDKSMNHITGKSAETDINNKRIGVLLGDDGIPAVGVRIISQDTDSIQQFNKGKKLNEGTKATPTAQRRKYKSSRRLKSRYKLRREKLKQVLAFLGMMPDEKYYTSDKTATRKGKFEIEDIGTALYELRDRAYKEQITLQELGRVMLHLNQWRGYSSDRFSNESEDELSAKNDFYTSIVTNIITLEPTKKKNKTVDIIEFYNYEIHFDNGDIAIDKVKWHSDAKTNFIKGEPNTYKKKRDEETGTEYLTWKTKDKNSYAYRKWEINDSVNNYCKNGGTVGSYFYQNVYKENNLDRIRTNVVNRDWYEKEFEQVFNLQFDRHSTHFNEFDIKDIVAAAFHKTYKNGNTNETYAVILNEIKKNSTTLKEQIKYLISKVIIFYQRPWQQANIKGECEFEKILVEVKKKNKKTGLIEDVNEYRGRTVIPRSHPLQQEFKIWNQINNVKLFFNNHDVKLELLGKDATECKLLTGYEANEIKQILYKELNTNSELTWRTFIEKLLETNEYKVIVTGLGRNKSLTEDNLPEIYFTINYTKRNRKTKEIKDDKLKGNKTFVQLNKIINQDIKWFNTIWKSSSDNHKANAKPRFEKGAFKQSEYGINNFQILWETIYDISIEKKEKVAKLLRKKFPELNVEQSNQLGVLKFDDAGMASLSAKAIKKLLPLMQLDNVGISINKNEKVTTKINEIIAINSEEIDKDDEDKLTSIAYFFVNKNDRKTLSSKMRVSEFKGLKYNEAAAVVYGNHSNKIIKGNFKAIETVRQHSLKNPVVEKIVNETIRIVNEIYKKYQFDEVRIELSRELKASADEREQMSDSRDKNTDKNEWAKEMLRELFNTFQNNNLPTANLDSTSKSSNIDKIKIMEDIANERFNQEQKLNKTITQPSKSDIQKYILWVEQMHRCPYTDEVIPLTDVFHKDKIVEIEHIIPRERFLNNSFSNKVITWNTINKDKNNRTAYEYIVSKRNTANASIVLDKNSSKSAKEVNLVNADRWKEHIEKMFPKGAKRNNLLRKEIPQEPLERELNDTQYISKKLKEKLSEIVGSEKVHTSTGSVTDILRESWHLNDVIKELTKERFEQFKIIGKTVLFEIKSNKLQSFADELKEKLDDNEKKNEIRIELKAEKNILLNSKELITETYNHLINFISNQIKLTTKTIYVSKEEFELLGDTNITEALKQLNIAKQNNNNHCKLIIEPEEIFYTDSEEEINDILTQLEEYISENEETTKAFKYSRKAIVNLLSENKENQINPIQYNGYSKRIDHRHHALDAIIVACTMQKHIQYINNMNTINNANQDDEKEKKEKYLALKEDVCRVSKEGHLQANKFLYPWSNYNKTHILTPLETLIVSHKNANALISPSTNKNIKNSGSQASISIRGKLHEETIYAKKKYVDMSEKGKVPITKLLKQILKRKLEQQETKQEDKSFTKIINDILVKVKYQEIMNELFAPYSDIKLCEKEIENVNSISINFIEKEFQDKLLKTKPFINKNGDVLTWLRVYQVKDKAVRPNGLTMNFNNVKDGIKNIANDRIKKITNYRLAFINDRLKQIENNSDLNKDEKVIEKSIIYQTPLYSNAIYEIKIKTGNSRNTYSWIEIKDLTENDLNNLFIDYSLNTEKEKAEKKKVEKIKTEIEKIGLMKFKETYFTNPICLSSKLILIKKTRERAFYNNLVEIRPKQYVNPLDTYACYLLNENEKVEIYFIKCLDAVKLISGKNIKINPIQIAELNNINTKNIKFILQRGDVVYVPYEDDATTIDWTNLKNILPHLQIVKDINPSKGNEKILFAKINTATNIVLSQKDVLSLFNDQYDKAFTEEIKYGTKPMLQKIIKVFINPLGKKIVPYWEFPNGCWDKLRAIELGLISHENEIEL